MTALPKIPRPKALLALAASAVLSAAGAQSGTAGIFTDTRDWKAYRTVAIGKQKWMAENLNFRTERSVCYGNLESNCQKYGRLYSWDDAMKACPAPWRVPSDKDWDSLAIAAGGKGDGSGDWEIAGEKLKSKSGWSPGKDGSIIAGTDDYGFSALPGGAGDNIGNFKSVGTMGYWWSATENSAPTAWGRIMYTHFDGMYRDYTYKTHLFSLRCVQ